MRTSITCISKEFRSYRDLIQKIMEEKPETRENDTLLYLECCRRLGAETVDEMRALGLNIITVHKTRQRLQNVEKRLLPKGA